MKVPRSLVAVPVATALVATGCGATGGHAHGDGGLWRVAFTGYGHVVHTARSGVTRITLVPARPASAEHTHAALVLSQRCYGDLVVDTLIRTNSQLRRPHPNPWEVGWVLWHYRDSQHFYFIVLKPNGWELGKQDPAYSGNQRYLATGARPVFPTRRWYALRVQQRGGVITIAVGGRRLVRYADTENPYRSGRIGLYTEDASATFQPAAIGAAP